MMLFVPPHRREKVRQKLDRLIHVPFQFDVAGSQIVFFAPETDYSNEERAREHFPAGAFVELSDEPRRLAA
jgi:D-glycero-alpha-D-manno-heptose-7-phosphate kinase